MSHIATPAKRPRTLLVAGVVALALTVAFALAAASPETAYAKSKNSKACATYKTLLSKKSMKWGYSKVATSSLKFACQDINKDGIKDLVLYNSNATEADGGFYRVYTYAKGKAKRVGTYYSLRVCRNKNFFSDSRAHMDSEHYNYYRLGKNGKVKKLASYDTQMMYEPYGTTYKKKMKQGIPFYYYNFKVNGKAASYFKCMSTIKSLKKNSKDTLKYRANTAKNRAKYLK